MAGPVHIPPVSLALPAVTPTVLSEARPAESVPARPDQVELSPPKPTPPPLAQAATQGSLETPPQNTNRTSAEKTSAGYAPAGRYLWDSWVLKSNQGDYLLFHLDAPGDVGPDERHDLAQIRQARSTDMEHWTDLGVTFGPGPEGAWDDKVVWSGNTYQEDGKYFLFYTARHKETDLNLGQIQRIGVATSGDGVHWQRREQPLLEPDGRYYETSEPSPIYKAWRDPAVVKDPESGKYLMYFTAKTKDGDERYKGCIGVAQSDSIDGPYEVQKPVLAPGLYAEMECPQVLQHGGKTYLFFSTFAKNYQPEWAEKIGGGVSGLHCFVADSLTGDFKPLHGNGLVEGLGTDSNLYGAHLAPDPKRPGEATVIGWYRENRDSLASSAQRCALSQSAGLVGGAAGPALFRGAEEAFKLVAHPLPLHWSGDTPYVGPPR